MANVTKSQKREKLKRQIHKLSVKLIKISVDLEVEAERRRRVFFIPSTSPILFKDTRRKQIANLQRKIKGLQVKLSKLDGGE